MNKQRALPRLLFYGVLYFLARLFDLLPGFFYRLIDFLAGFLDRALFRAAKWPNHQDDHHQPCDDTLNQFLHWHPPVNLNDKDGSETYQDKNRHKLEVHMFHLPPRQKLSLMRIIYPLNAERNAQRSDQAT